MAGADFGEPLLLGRRVPGRLPATAQVARKVRRLFPGVALAAT